MNILETQWWSLCVPPEWWAEQDEESIVVGDNDDVGCIEVSTLCRDDGDFSAAEVKAIAAEQHEVQREWQAVSLADQDGVYCSFTEEDAAVREWYLGCGSLLLFITYSCDLENLGLDDAAVDEILNTLVMEPI
ncbi:MAG: hypothetical protein ACI9GW_002012 [Halieaceae bacterium]|jgi:hypothetical protein